MDKGIAEEREKLSFLKKKANYLLDTSHMLTRELKGELNKIFVENKEYKNLYITVLSFGNTESQVMQILYLMSVFCRTHII